MELCQSRFFIVSKIFISAVFIIIFYNFITILACLIEFNMVNMTLIMDRLWLGNDYQEAVHGNLIFGLSPTLSCFDNFKSAHFNMCKIQRTSVLRDSQKITLTFIHQNRGENKDSSLIVFLKHVVYQVHDAIRVSVLVVIPCHNLHKCWVQHDSSCQ